MNIHFEKANLSHIDTIFNWLTEPHIQEFWDNSQAHKDDILNFVNGRKKPSDYCNGLYAYWVGSINCDPYCLVMTLQEKREYDIPALKKDYLSKHGHTYSMDYMIGNKAYFGKGLGAQTLKAFIDFIRESYDVKADTFFIDPDVTNPKAKHVYEKAGFKYIDDFIMEGEGGFKGRKTHFLVKHIPLKAELVLATLEDYPTIQNMARFYVYDLSRDCGFISNDWAMPADGLYESFGFKEYFEDQSRKVYLIKIGDELAGFSLLNQVGTNPTTNWNMGELFVIAKFQSKGVGGQVAHQIFNMHPGIWEVSVIPENKSALRFWESTINSYTNGNFENETKIVVYDEHQPQRIIFSFDTGAKNASNNQESILIRSAKIPDIPALVDLSYQKRLLYEKAQSQFWRYAGPKAEESQAKWFEELFTHDSYIMLTAEINEKITGFIIGRLIPAPAVYNPGGVTLIIDDFCVERETLWEPIGTKLIDEIKAIIKTKDAAQVLVVCGTHDESKRHFLKKMGLTVASEWYVGSVW